MMKKFAFIKVFNHPEKGLEGNTSAVIFNDNMPADAEMQQMAADLAQPATTFLAPKGENQYEVRWFAPDAEIGLCGHGSAAAVVFLGKYFSHEKVRLHYPDGVIEGGMIQDQFYIFLEPIEVINHRIKSTGLEEALGVKVLDYFTTLNKHIVLIESEKALRNMQPDFKALAKLEPFGYAVTAPGEEVDFVSRTLVPKVQQLEDHATGSSHAALVPFWSERLRKNTLSAQQLSPRGGYFNCEMALSKVELCGKFEIILNGDG